MPQRPGITGRFAVEDESALRVIAYDGSVVAALPRAGVLFCAAFSSDSARLAVGDTKGGLRVWDLSTTDKPGCVFCKAHPGFVSSVSFWPGGGRVATAGWDGVACVWEVSGRGLRKMASVRAEGEKKGKSHAVAVSAVEEGVIASGGSGGVVRVWRIAGGGKGMGEPVAVHDAHAAAVYRLAFAPDGRHVASGSADGTVRVFGVPGKPVLVSRGGGGVDRGEGMEGAYEIRKMDVVLKGQRADRRLIFCPSNVVTLTCPICTSAYDSERRAPICSGACGHTFACRVCNDRLWETDREPSCPVCRVALVDVAPNYELLRVLEAATQAAPAEAVTQVEAARASRGRSGREEFGDDYIDLKRLSWMELPELAYMSRHSCAVYSGTMDGETVAVRLSIPGADQSQSDASGLRMTETARHLRCLKRLRGPHILQLYGVSRTTAPDNRTVVVSELPSGGTLSDNLSLLRNRKRSLPAETILSLSLQIIRALRFLHESQTSAGWALSPDAIALSMPITADWSMRHRVKFMELGGTVSKSECSTDMRREFPSDYIGYMAPEILDEDRSTLVNREDVFRRLCESDLYSLGVLLWEIASGNKPFEGKRPAQVVAAVVGRGERPGFPPSGIAAELQDLITKLWAKEPGNRPTAKEACDLLETVPSAPPML